MAKINEAVVGTVVKKFLKNRDIDEDSREVDVQIVVVKSKMNDVYLWGEVSNNSTDISKEVIKYLKTDTSKLSMITSLPKIVYQISFSTFDSDDFGVLDFKMITPDVKPIIAGWCQEDNPISFIGNPSNDDFDSIIFESKSDAMDLAMSMKRKFEANDATAFIFEQN